MSIASEAVPPSFSDSVDSQLPPDYVGPQSSSMVPSRLYTEREYTLESEGKPWAFLKVICRSGSANSLPFFVQGEPITGTVELHLQKTDHIQAVTIEARGESFSAGEDPVPFLAQETTLWSTAMGDPGNPASGVGSPKLMGDYVWPFYITLPDKVIASAVAKMPGSEYSIPPSFSERTSPCYLEYRLLVTFRRTRFRVNSILSTLFGFLPRLPTPAPSALRQLAYRENRTPPGPKADPEGWEVLGTKSVTGTVFESRQVEVSCSLALAKPLCYTRGTFIPFFLTLSCSDSQALDLFAGRGSLAIRLMRALDFGKGATDGDMRKRIDKKLSTRAGWGVSWLSNESNEASSVRMLEGEIHLRGELKPSFVFPRLCVTYHVTLDLKAPGFTPHSRDSGESTFSREVVITTYPAPAPAARSRVPPTLQAQPPEDNDEDTLGVLAIGTSRMFFGIDA